MHHAREREREREQRKTGNYPGYPYIPTNCNKWTERRTDRQRNGWIDSSIDGGESVRETGRQACRQIDGVVR